MAKFELFVQLKKKREKANQNGRKGGREGQCER